MENTLRLNNNSGFIGDKNSCFVNTAIQIFIKIPRIQKLFKTRGYRIMEDKKRKMPVCDELFRLINMKGAMTTSAAELRRLVGELSKKPHLKDGSQQDVLEFLLALSEQVKAEISISNLVGKTVLQGFIGVERTERKFTGTIKGRCSKCKTLPIPVEEDFAFMKVNIPQTEKVISLSKIVKNHVDEQEDIKMKCSKCCVHRFNCPAEGECELVDAFSQKVMIKSPDVLIIQLGRFQSSKGPKLQTKIWPDDELNMQFGEFNLHAIAHHLGGSMENGHYVASIKHGNKWLRCNDTEISVIEDSQVKSDSNYIVVYTRKFTRNKRQMSVNKEKYVGHPEHMLSGLAEDDEKAEEIFDSGKETKDVEKDKKFTKIVKDDAREIRVTEEDDSKLKDEKKTNVIEDNENRIDVVNKNEKDIIVPEENENSLKTTEEETNDKLVAKEFETGRYQYETKISEADENDICVKIKDKKEKLNPTRKAKNMTVKIYKKKERNHILLKLKTDGKIGRKQKKTDSEKQGIARQYKVCTNVQMCFKKIPKNQRTTEEKKAIKKACFYIARLKDLHPELVFLTNGNIREANTERNKVTGAMNNQSDSYMKETKSFPLMAVNRQRCHQCNIKHTPYLKFCRWLEEKENKLVLTNPLSRNQILLDNNMKFLISKRIKEIESEFESFVDKTMKKTEKKPEILVGKNQDQSHKCEKNKVNITNSIIFLDLKRMLLIILCLTPCAFGNNGNWGPKNIDFYDYGLLTSLIILMVMMLILVCSGIYLFFCQTNKKLTDNGMCDIEMSEMNPNIYINPRRFSATTLLSIHDELEENSHAPTDDNSVDHVMKMTQNIFEIFSLDAIKNKDKIAECHHLALFLQFNQFENIDQAFIKNKSLQMVHKIEINDVEKWEFNIENCSMCPMQQNKGKGKGIQANSVISMKSEETKCSLIALVLAVFNTESFKIAMKTINSQIDVCTVGTCEFCLILNLF